MSVDGNWLLAVDSPMGKQEFGVRLEEDGGRLSGSVTNGSQMTSEIFDGVANGTELQWKVELQRMKMTVAFTMTVDGDTMSGKAKVGMFGSFAVTGKRAD